jgi:hypothetical protein
MTGLVLLIAMVVLYSVTRKSGQRPESKYKIHDAERYFRRTDSDKKKTAGTGDFIGREEPEADFIAWIHSSSRGMSLMAYDIRNSAQIIAEQKPGFIIRDDSVR